MQSEAAPAATKTAPANGKPATKPTAEKPPAKGKAPKKPAPKKANPKAGALSFLKIGAPVVKSVPLDKLNFDRRLQHRSKLVDDATVDSYADTDAENAKEGKPSVFPALKAVHVTKDEKGKPCDVYYVYDGFQRGAAFAKNKRKDVQVEVIDGTFEDAFFLSLGSNGTNSELPRNRDDKRRSVFALIDSEHAMKVLGAKVDAFGGLTRALAAACLVSLGTIDNALKDRGLRVSGSKLVKRPAEKPEEKPPAEAKPDAALAAPKPTAAPAAEISAEAKRKADDAAFAAMCQANHVDRVRECEKLNRRLGALMATLVSEGVHRAEVRAAMKNHALGLSDEFDVRARKQGKDFAPYYEILELWPVTAKLGAFFAEIKKLGEKKPEQETDTTPAKDAK